MTITSLVAVVTPCKDELIKIAEDLLQNGILCFVIGLSHELLKSRLKS